MLLFYSFTAKYAAPQNHNHAYLEKNESGIHVNVCLEVENLQIFNKPHLKGGLRKVITIFFRYINCSDYLHWKMYNWSLFTNMVNFELRNYVAPTTTCMLFMEVTLYYKDCQYNAPHYMNSKSVCASNLRW